MYKSVVLYNNGKSSHIQADKLEVLQDILQSYSFLRKDVKIISIFNPSGSRVGTIKDGTYDNLSVLTKKSG